MYHFLLTKQGSDVPNGLFTYYLGLYFLRDWVKSCFVLLGRNHLKKEGTNIKISDLQCGIR